MDFDPAFAKFFADIVGELDISAAFLRDCMDFAVNSYILSDILTSFFFAL